MNSALALIEARKGGDGTAPSAKRRKQVPGSKGSPMTEHPTGAKPGKATLREVYDLLNGLSDSQFAVMASGEHCEDLLSMIVGAIGRSFDTRAMNAARTTPIDDEGLETARIRLEKLAATSDDQNIRWTAQHLVDCDDEILSAIVKASLLTPVIEEGLIERAAKAICSGTGDPDSYNGVVAETARRDAAVALKVFQASVNVS